MNLYTNKKRWKWILAIVALLIVGASLWYTNNLVKSIAVQETNQVQLWAAAMEQHAGMMKSTEEFFNKVSEQEQMRVDLLALAYRQVLDFSSNENTGIYLEIIKNNISIPLVITDDRGNIMFSNNLPENQKDKKVFDAEMRSAYSKFAPIKINPGYGQIQWLYYNESLIYTELKAVLEDMINHLMEEITLNALGVPVIITDEAGTEILNYGNLDSTMMQNADYVERQMALMRSENEPLQIEFMNTGKAYIYYRTTDWVELLKMQEEPFAGTDEMEKDIERLQIVTDRFSKIGSIPVLEPNDIIPLIQDTMEYLQRRFSKKFEFDIRLPEGPLVIPLVPSLFRWVLENLTKNAIDAMGDKGKITLELTDGQDEVTIDLSDTGKGIAKKQFKQVFAPGYTSKKRGWGLGLSLSKRIIEEYHKGKIFVKSSVVGQGTTFRIILKKE